VQRALRLEQIESDPSAAVDAIVPLEEVLPDVPTVTLSEAETVRVLHGNDIVRAACRTGDGEDAVRLLAPDGRLLAIGRPVAGAGLLHPAVVLR